MKFKFFNEAFKQSKFSTHHKHKIGGVIVKKSKIISKGYNKLKTHPASNHTYKNIHCELDCILKAPNHLLKDAELYLYRNRKSDTIGNSRPCTFCEELVRKFGIKKVYYTVDYAPYWEMIKV